MASRTAFWPMWLLSGLFIVPAAFFWFMSPFGLGFANMTDGPADRVFETLFRLSYFVLNPACILAWLTLPLWQRAGLSRRGWQMLAWITLLFATCVALTLVVL